MSDLQDMRRRLDALDAELIRFFAARFDICREVAEHKRTQDIPMMQPGRVDEVRAGYLQRGRELGVPEEFTQAMFEALITASCALEDEIIAGGAESGSPS